MVAFAGMQPVATNSIQSVLRIFTLRTPFERVEVP